MTVSVGDAITASQYNTLSASINKFWGDIYSSNTPSDSKSENSYGWGNLNSVTVSIGDNITADRTNELINRINLGITQVGSGSVITKVVVGNDILAAEHNDIETEAASLDGNRLTAADTTITSGGNDDSESRTSWSHRTEVICKATFASYADARYFFNSGGQLRYSFDCSGSSDTALAWDDLFDADDMGTLIFSYNDVAQTGSRAGNIASGSGFYELTTSDVELYDIELDTSPYTKNDFEMKAKRNASGTEVIITFTLNNDDHEAETVDGNTTVYLDNRKSDDKAGTTPSVNFSITGFSTHVAASWTGS